MGNEILYNPEDLESDWLPSAPCPTCSRPLTIRTEWSGAGMEVVGTCEAWWCRVRAIWRAVWSRGGE